MHRRDFSRSLLAAGATAAAGMGLTPALAQRVAFQEGKDFVRLAKPAMTESPAGQVEVVEFFAYSCIHCFNFEPVFNEWVKRKPAHVNVRRMPVAFNQNFVPMQRLYFTLEAMNLVDTLHVKVFKAIHEERQARRQRARARRGERVGPDGAHHPRARIALRPRRHGGRPAHRARRRPALNRRPRRGLSPPRRRSVGSPA